MNAVDRARRTLATATTLTLSGLLAVALAAGVAPDSPGAWYRLAEDDRRAMRLTQAVRGYNRAIALDPADGRPYIGLAVLYETVNRADLALDALEQLRIANPAAPHLWCRLAEAHLGAEDVHSARVLGEQAAAHEPYCARAFSAYGIALLRSRYSIAAAAALERAWALAPADLGILEVLVQALLDQGDYLGAIRLGRPFLAADPAFARLHYRVGLAFSRLPPTHENVDQAARHLREAATLDPHTFEPLAELGRMYRSLGRRSEAASAFEEAWRINPTVPGVAFNLASLWRQAGDARAAAMERRVVELSRGSDARTTLRVRYNQQALRSETTLELARLEGRTGHYGTALVRVRKLLADNPTDLGALELYRSLDRKSRTGYPDYLRPGFLAAR